jgi:hypothetical protein
MKFLTGFTGRKTEHLKKMKKPWWRTMRRKATVKVKAWIMSWSDRYFDPVGVSTIWTMGC